MHTQSCDTMYVDRLPCTGYHTRDIGTSERHMLWLQREIWSISHMSISLAIVARTTPAHTHVYRPLAVTQDNTQGKVAFGAPAVWGHFTCTYSMLQVTGSYGKVLWCAIPGLGSFNCDQRWVTRYAPTPQTSLSTRRSVYAHKSQRTIREHTLQNVHLSDRQREHLVSSILGLCAIALDRGEGAVRALLFNIYNKPFCAFELRLCTRQENKPL